MNLEELTDEIDSYEKIKEGIAHQYYISLMEGTLYAQDICFESFHVVDNILGKLYKKRNLARCIR